VRFYLTVGAIRVAQIGAKGAMGGSRDGPAVRMRVAALYDIHGNLPALEAVLQEVRRESVDGIVVGGDVVPGPMPVETLELLSNVNLPVDFIHGNGDREVLARMRGMETSWYRDAREEWRVPVRWTAEQLGPEHERALACWRSTLRLEVSDVGDLLFCHATPHNDTDCFTRVTPDSRLGRLLGEVDAPFVVCGHTHMQFDRHVGNVRVINAGSVGAPFGNPGAYWLLLGPTAQLRCTAYDLDEAAQRIRATEYPHAHESAAHILQPPSEEEMLKAYGRADLN